MMNIKNGELINFDAANYTAVICLAGSHKVYLEDVAVARNLPSAEMIAGRKVIAVFFEENNPGEAVVVGVYT